MMSPSFYFFLFLTVCLKVSGVRTNSEIPDCFTKPAIPDNEETTLASAFTTLFCMGNKGSKISLGAGTGCFADASCDTVLSISSTKYSYKFWDIYTLREDGNPVQGTKLFIGTDKIHVPRSLELHDVLIAEGVIDSRNGIKLRSYISTRGEEEKPWKEIDRTSDQFSFKINTLAEDPLVRINGRNFVHYPFYTVEKLHVTERDELYLDQQPFYPYLVSFVKTGSNDSDKSDPIMANVLSLNSHINLIDEFKEEELYHSQVDTFAVGSPEPSTTTTTTTTTTSTTTTSTSAPATLKPIPNQEEPAEDHPEARNEIDKNSKPVTEESSQERPESSWFNCWNILMIVSVSCLLVVLIVIIVLVALRRRRRRTGSKKVTLHGVKPHLSQEAASRVCMTPDPDHNHNQDGLEGMEPLMLPPA